MAQILLPAFLTIFSLSHLNAQVSITAQLLDLKNGDPLPFASIYLEGTSIGTTSNLEGSFVFHIPEEQKNKLITISMIGYESVQKAVSDFEENESIYLKESIFELDEVVITNKKALTAKEIVQKAYQAIDTNYPSEPYILEGFVRDLQNEDSVYVELLEYAVKMRYRSNAIQRKPAIELLALRQSYIAEKHPWNNQWDRKNSMVDLVEDDFIRFDYGPIKFRNGWKYELEKVLAFGEKMVYKIKAVHKPFYSAQFYIDTESFAFVRIEYKRAALNKRNYKRRLTNGQQEKSYHLIFEYQEYKGKWYLKYQKEEDSWAIYKGLETNKLLFTKYPKKELFINKVITETVDQYPFSNNLEQNKSIESQAKPYNPAFWKHYNAPAQTKELSKIEAYLSSSRR